VVVLKVWQCWMWAWYLEGCGSPEGVAVLDVGGRPRLPGQEGEEAAGGVAGRVGDPLQDGVHQGGPVASRAHPAPPHP
jgi:hypothetical protein